MVRSFQRRSDKPSIPFSDIHLKEEGEIQRETIVERDVEVNLLEPLLIKLGFRRQDWVRQLPVQIGRGEKTFPDYAILVNNAGECPIPKYVWEAKSSIPNEQQLHKDFRQARSYALLLQSKALCLVSKEGVWFVGADSGFEFAALKHSHSDSGAFEDLSIRLRQCPKDTTAPITEGLFSCEASAQRKARSGAFSQK